MTEKMEIRVQAFQVIEKTVRPSGNSGRVYVPKEWVGKNVKVFLLQQIADEEKNKGSKNKQFPTGNRQKTT